jgi:hypothetical protein
VRKCSITCCPAKSGWNTTGKSKHAFLDGFPKMNPEISIEVASDSHLTLADLICDTIKAGVVARGTGIAGRTPDDIREKIRSGKAVVAMHCNGDWAGFAYWAVWENGQYVSHSGLIVNPIYRQQGVADLLKHKLLDLTRAAFPHARIFSITTSQAVMSLNSKLGYHAVAFSELPQDERFWGQCAGCQHHDILHRTGGKYCLCTGMLLEPEQVA